MKRYYTVVLWADGDLETVHVEAVAPREALLVAIEKTFIEVNSPEEAEEFVDKTALWYVVFEGHHEPESVASDDQPSIPAEIPKPVIVDGQSLVCPHCNCHDFKYVEDIQNWRQVLSVDEDQLVIDGFYKTGEGYDDGENPRLVCSKCAADFPIPDELECEFE